MCLAINYIETATFFILAVSALASTYLYYRTKDKEREKETFDYIDDKFNDFLEICLNKPYLDVFDTKDIVEFKLTDMQKKEEQIAFAYLMSIFERVYIFYVENRKKCDSDQFVNWTKTIKEYFKRDNFKKAWRENGYGWDPGFITFMDNLYLKSENKIILKPINSREDVEKWYSHYNKSFLEDKDNDNEEQIYQYLDRDSKYPYHFYHMTDIQGVIVGGMLTQTIKHVVVIIYIFVNKEYRHNGYGDLALKSLRKIHSNQYCYLAEVEHRNSKRKPWWLNQMFEVVDIQYFTPEIDYVTYQEIKANLDNDLLIFNAHLIKPKELAKVLEIYFKTSYVKNTKTNISQYQSVINNNEQILKWKKFIDTK